MKRMISTLAALLVASTIALPLTAAAYSFSGKIYETGTFGTRLLPNATVRFMPGNYVNTSAASGAYLLYVPAGTYVATITAQGHVPQTQQVIVSGDGVRDFVLKTIETQVRFNLTGSIQERLANGATRLLPGASVVVNPGNIGAISDANGRFAIPNLPGGIYTITASASGHGSTSRRVSLTANNDVTLVLPVTSTGDNNGTPRAVTGTIVASTGGAIPGATIRLTPGNVRATADGNGTFTFPSLRPGTYMAHIRASGFKPVNRRITIGSTGMISLVMTRLGSNAGDNDRIDRRGRGNGDDDDDRGRGKGKGKSGRGKQGKDK